MWSAIKARWQTLLTALATGALVSIAALSTSQKQQLKDDIEWVATKANEHPEARALLPLLEHLCPTCTLPAKTHCKLAAEPGYYCRDGLKYGPGLGGVDVDGNPVVCVCGGSDPRHERVCMRRDCDKIREALETATDEEKVRYLMRTVKALKDEVL